MKLGHYDLSCPLHWGLVAALLCLPLSSQAERAKFADIAFVKIEAGCFEMGLDQNIKAIRDTSQTEMPKHKVCLDKAFYMAETEITQRQWESVMQSNPSKFKSPSKPVERVSWDDVQIFLKRLNEKEGGNSFRLPTEAEWEYAARAGSDDLYSFGDSSSDLHNYAWYGDRGYHGNSHDVADKKPNAWGLYDMHGNVLEWVQDWYDPTYYAHSPANNPKGPDSSRYKVYRGGSWVGDALSLRSSARFSNMPSAHSSDLGFRIVKDTE